MYDPIFAQHVMTAHYEDILAQARATARRPSRLAGLPFILAALRARLRRVLSNRPVPATRQSIVKPDGLVS